MSTYTLINIQVHSFFIKKYSELPFETSCEPESNTKNQNSANTNAKRLKNELTHTEKKIKPTRSEPRSGRFRLKSGNPNEC